MTASRRELLSAGALVVAFSLAPQAFSQGGRPAQGGAPPPKAPNLPGSLKNTPMLDAWIRVDGSGQVTVFTGKAELGQGIKTALIQVAAEELDLPPSALRLVTADTERTPNEGVTAGSHSMQDSGTAILNAAANVRQLLAEAAARRWNVQPEAVSTTGDGRFKGPAGQTAGYGELAAGLSLHVEARPDAPRRQGVRRTIGRTQPRVDIPAKCTGGPAYVQDLRLPGMLHARVVRGLSEGAKLKPADVRAVEAMPGVVKVVQEGAFTAVVAERQWTAIQAMRALQRAGSERAGAPLPADLKANLLASPAEDETILDSTASPGPQPVKPLKARYSRPWLLHGSIGPSCAVAHFDRGEANGGKLTVWTHTQGVYPLRAALAELTRLPPQQIHCIHTEGSGCYGHNAADDVAADAALTALAVPGRPIRLQWMREQEHGFEPMGTGMVVDIEAGVDGEGHISGWRSTILSPSHNGRPGRAGNLLAGPEMDPPFMTPRPRPIPMPEGGGDRNGIPLYRLGDARIVSRFVPDSPVRVSALRSLGGFMNVVAIESFIDELALAGGLDPVDFRLKNLDDPRAIAVIKAAATRFGWPGRAKGSGFAFARYKNLAAYCAVAMQVDVDRETGRVRIGKAVAAVDAGEAVNPGGVQNQIEGAIVQAISWTGHEAMTFDASGRTGLDWSGYPILRFEDAPASVTVLVLDQPGQPFLGAGEAGQGPAGAAFCNAIAAATGMRLRDLPLTAARLKAALSPAGAVV